MDIPWFQVELNISYKSDSIVININLSLEWVNSSLNWIVKECFIALATLWIEQERIWSVTEKKQAKIEIERN